MREDESYLFTGLRFGYKYFFGVSAIDEARSKRTSIEAFKQQESPDCYLETGDREFCRTQSVEISGVPLDFQVDCVAPSLSDQGDTGQYTAVLSWTPPIQVNGRITDYELRYGKSSSNLAEQIPYYKKTKVYSKELRHLEEFSNFTAQVRAFVDGKGGPKATLKFNTYHEQLANDLSHQSECDELF
ncbi:uncharacterized protein LOC119740638 [Patiria miniata]|uniref:Fibronectin type-III domain-containing protein n=1 Tax=Patiria miniata TaxID=46514 RepID=A0A914B7Y9_PATMI|nr:uncharacterized protein LOC119740638 [Patiria miniata]